MNFPLLIAPALLAFALPLKAEIASQELEYKSVFDGYRAYSDSEIQNWPAMIKQVEEIGGWRVYSREPSENNLETKPATGAPTSPTSGPTTGTAPQQIAPHHTPQPSQPHQHGGAK